jgi:mannitol-1-phosphate/altronate dehydrogenase
VAAWLAYCAEILPASRGRWTPDDPVTPRLVGARDLDGLARALLSVEEVFGADLARDDGFRHRVTATARRLVAGEIAAALGGPA